MKCGVLEASKKNVSEEGSEKIVANAINRLRGELKIATGFSNIEVTGNLNEDRFWFSSEDRRLIGFRELYIRDVYLSIYYIHCSLYESVGC